MIQNLKQFVNESYLSGSRQPLYHLTNKLYSILKSDILKSYKAARTSHGEIKSISLTMNINYSLDDSGYGEIFEIDVDKLLNDGIKPYPVDEIAWQDGKPNEYVIKSDKNYSKSGFDIFKKGLRGTKHNLNLPNNPTVEYEFEERIFKDIEKIGKYIISLNSTNNTFSNENIEIISNYLIEYPHIKINIIDDSNRNKKIDITYKFSKIDQLVFT